MYTTEVECDSASCKSVGRAWGKLAVFEGTNGIEMCIPKGWLAVPDHDYEKWYCSQKCKGSDD